MLEQVLLATVPRPAERYTEQAKAAPCLHIATPDLAGIALCGAPGKPWVPPHDLTTPRPPSCGGCATWSQPWRAEPQIMAYVLPQTHPSGDALYAELIQDLRLFNKGYGYPSPLYGLEGALSRYGTAVAYAQCFGLVRRHVVIGTDPDPQDDAAKLARLTGWGQLYMQWIQQGLPAGSLADCRHHYYVRRPHQYTKRAGIVWHRQCAPHATVALPDAWDTWLALLRASPQITCFRCIQLPYTEVVLEP